MKKSHDEISNHYFLFARRFRIVIFVDPILIEFEGKKTVLKNFFRDKAINKFDRG